MSSERRGDWIQCYPSGAKFYPLDPRPEDIHIGDIANALGNIARFTGHTKFHYSVAIHSYMVSWVVPPADALWGLLHDAAEAYISDLARPLKVLEEFGAFRHCEGLIMRAVCERFGLDPEEPESVKRADKGLLIAEAQALLGPLGPEWDRWREYEIPGPGNVNIPSVTPQKAGRLFLHRFQSLTEKVSVA